MAPSGFRFQSLSGYFIAHESMVSDGDNTANKVCVAIAYHCLWLTRAR